MDSKDIVAVTIKPLGDKYDDSNWREISHYVGRQLIHITDTPLQSFAYERNKAYSKTNDGYAKWALQLDTDVHYLNFPISWFNMLEVTEADVIYLYDDIHSYAVPRLFRLPMRGSWKGFTHEYYDHTDLQAGWWDAPVHRENPKTPEQFTAKCKRDIILLNDQTAEEPENGRWYFYLGQSHMGLADYPEAIRIFKKCATISKWDEERAWALYSAAECQVNMSAYNTAIRTLARAQFIRPDYPEIPWLIAFCYHELHDYYKAISWAKMAASLGKFTSMGLPVLRRGFSYPPAMYEGPFDVLACSYKSLGYDQYAEVSRALFESAKATRTHVIEMA